MIYRIYILILLILSTINLVSQNENAKWFFGHGAAIDFLTNPPSFIANSSMTVLAGASSIADANGNLLFYSNGNTVWDKTDSVMANGTGLFTSIYANTSSLIVKQPGSTNTYYIFTLDGSQFNSAGFNYSVIDMSLAAGMGSVTIKNSPVYTGYCAQKLTGTQHSNGTDYWVVIHEMLTNNFRSYLVTSAGVNTVPVVSSVGTIYAQWEITGRMKISPTGNKIGLRYSGNGNQQELYDFDNSTGIVSNPLILPSSNTASGIEFSSDGSKFYGSVYINNQNSLSQWNLSAATGSAILASMYTVPCGNLGEMQLAPNGKIYIARFQQSDLGVINNPNCSGSGCNYVDQGFSIAPKYTWWSIPNLITSPLNSGGIFVGGNKNLCPGESTTLTIGGAISYTWSTGVTSSVIALSPSVTTQYSVVTTQSTCANSTTVVTIPVTVTVNPTPTIVVSGNFSVCSGFQSTINAAGGTTYTWSTGQTGPTTILSPLTTTFYTVSGTDSLSSCYDVRTFTINVFPLPSIQITGNNPICAGQNATLSALGANTFTWNIGANTSSIIISPVGNAIYQVIGSSINNCQDTAEVNFIVNPLPNINASTMLDTVCAGETTTLIASGGIIYNWFNGTTGPEIHVIPFMTTTYTVMGIDTNGCSQNSSITVFVDACTSLLEISKDIYPLIYPNPSKGIFVIQLNNLKPKTNVEIYNSMGQVVYFSLLLKNHTEISLTDFDNGIYFLKIYEDNHQVSSNKLIKNYSILIR